MHETTGDFTLDGPFLRAHKDRWAGIAVWAVGGALLLWNLAIKPIQALLLAALAMVASPQGAKLPFGAGFKVGTVALIPAVGLQVVQGLAGFDLPFGIMVYTAVAVLGTWFCARAARPPAPAAAPADPAAAGGTPPGDHYGGGYRAAP